MFLQPSISSLSLRSQISPTRPLTGRILCNLCRWWLVINLGSLPMLYWEMRWDRTRYLLSLLSVTPCKSITSRWELFYQSIKQWICKVSKVLKTSIITLLHSIHPIRPASRSRQGNTWGTMLTALCSQVLRYQRITHHLCLHLCSQAQETIWSSQNQVGISEQSINKTISGFSQLQLSNDFLC